MSSSHFVFPGLINLYRDPTRSTGVTMASTGKRIEAVSDLPDHAIELHVFSSDYAATAFISGLECIGLGNDVSYDYTPESGEMKATECVVLARLSEPRPDAPDVVDCVRIFKHIPPGHMDKRIAESNRRSLERYLKEEERSQVLTAPLRDALKTAGWEVHRYGATWLQCGQGRDIAVEVTWKESGSFDLTADVHETYDGNLDVTDLMDAYLGSSGFSYDPKEKELRAQADGVDGVVDICNRLLGVVHGAVEVRRAAWHQDFMANFQVTPTRRKFLAGVADGSGYIYFRRRNERASAAGVDIGATELNDLKRAKWIEVSGNSLKITEAGLEAAGLPMSAPARAP